MIGHFALSGGQLSLLALFVLVVAALIMRRVNLNKGAAQQSGEALPRSEKKDVGDEELLAVIAAAVAASLNTSTYNLKIKSFRRIPAPASEWNMAGRLENIRR